METASSLAEILASHLASKMLRPLPSVSHTAGWQEAVADKNVPLPTAAMTVSLVVASLTTRSCSGLLPMPQSCGSTQDTDGGPSKYGLSPPAARLRPGLHGLDGSHMTINRGDRSMVET